MAGLGLIASRVIILIITEELFGTILCVQVSSNPILQIISAASIPNNFGLRFKHMSNRLVVPYWI